MSKLAKSIKITQLLRQKKDPLSHWQVNTGSGNGLVPSCNKPLPEPMLTQTCVAIWRHKATMSYSNGAQDPWCHMASLIYSELQGYQPRLFDTCKKLVHNLFLCVAET